MAGEQREIILKAALERDVRLVRFEEGHIEFNLADGGSRTIAPQIDIFNLANADTVVNTTTAVGGSYLLPSGGDPILSPRIIRVGFSLNF